MHVTYRPCDWSPMNDNTTLCRHVVRQHEILLLAWACGPFVDQSEAERVLAVIDRSGRRSALGKRSRGNRSPVTPSSDLGSIQGDRCLRMDPPVVPQSTVPHDFSVPSATCGLADTTTHGLMSDCQPSEYVSSDNGVQRQNHRDDLDPKN